ncbi:MAG TPA: FtsH protease activity modulator HflK [Hyphomicrobiaceae bacterium]|nr:FtsH protease activity modulator HflK [Hyphomicrobiaceae bacterium]
MPWNNQNGGGNNKGPWGNKGGGGPWGQGPSGGGGGGGNQPPDLEELLKRSQDRLRKAMPGGGGGGGGIPGWAIMLIATLGIAFTAFSAFTFRVNPDEVGIVMRFGQYVRRADPGLHFRWPPPIEEVRFPKVTRQNTLQVGMRSVDRGRGFTTAPAGSETSHMLTGDENIVDINFVVRWQIKNDRVQDYLFNIQNPELTVEEVAESAMREIVGKMNIQPVLTESRQKIEQDVQKLMQDVLDSYGAGVRVVEVQLQRVDPPQEVIDAFRDVQAARADKERLQNEAATYANKIVPEARGEAERILQAAEGYKQQTIADANGQASRFLNVYEQYRKAPDLTRQRMYIETMERVLSQSDTIILDQKAGGQGVVPYLPLDQLQKRTEGK